MANNDVHFVMQEKGGVGKTLVAYFLAQYLREKCDAADLLCFDIDASNNSLARFRGLNVRALDLVENGEIPQEKFHPIFNELFGSDQPLVVDIGTSAVIAFLDFAVKMGLFEQIAADLGRRLFVHVVLMGGAEAEDTLESFKGIGGALPAAPGMAFLVPWCNPYHGKVIFDGDMSLKDTVIYKSLDEKGTLTEPIEIPERGAAFARTLNKITRDGLTFADAKQEKSLDFAEKHIVEQIRKGLYAEISAKLPQL